MSRKNRICPKCGKRYNDTPAISRRAGKEEICPNCGTMEAMEDMFAAVGCTAEEARRNMEKLTEALKNVDKEG